MNSKISKDIYADNYEYSWLNYKISDIQKVFKLFNKKINIVVDGGGRGQGMGD